MTIGSLGAPPHSEIPDAIYSVAADWQSIQRVGNVSRRIDSIRCSKHICSAVLSMDAMYVLRSSMFIALFHVYFSSACIIDIAHCVQDRRPRWPVHGAAPMSMCVLQHLDVLRVVVYETPCVHSFDTSGCTVLPPAVATPRTQVAVKTCAEACTQNRPLGAALSVHWGVGTVACCGRCCLLRGSAMLRPTLVWL